MRKKTKMLSALMACMMVATVFTAYLPAISADSSSNEVHVGDTITLTGSATPLATLIIYADSKVLTTTGAGIHGGYSVSVTVPEHVHGAITFQIHDTVSLRTTETSYIVMPQIVASPSKGVPSFAGGEKITLTATGFENDAEIIFAFGGVVLGSAFPTSSGTAELTEVDVPNHKAGYVALTGVQKGTLIGTGSFEVIAGIKITPQSGHGTETKVTIEGSGFQENGVIGKDSIEFKNQNDEDGVVATHEEIAIDDNGAFTAIVDLGQIPVGLYDVYITVDDLPAQAFIGEYIVGPLIVVEPTSATIGTTVSVKGYGFGANARFTITLDGALVEFNKTTTEADGSFAGAFVMPSVKLGGHYVRATDEFFNTASAIVASGPCIFVTPETGTVGPTTTTTDGVTSGSIYSSVHTYTDVEVIGHDYYRWYGTVTINESLGTEVTVQGAGFSSDSLVDVTVSIKNVIYTVVKEVPTNAMGEFEATFIFPTAPNGTYQISAVDSSYGSSKADFTVVPGMIIDPPVVVGPSIETVVATGFPVTGSAGVQDFLIDGTDALYGTNLQAITQWAFDDNGTLIGLQLTPNVPPAKPGFLLPVLQPGEYEITLVAGGASVSRNVIVMNSLVNLKDMMIHLDGLDAKIDKIDDKLVAIQTKLGTIEADLDALDIKIVKVDGKLVDINTALGTIKADLDDLDVVLVEVKEGVVTIDSKLGEIKASLKDLDAKIVEVKEGVATIKTELGDVQASFDDLNAKIVAVDGKLVAIQTSIGTIDGRIISIDGDVATIQTDVGTIKANVSTISGQTSKIADGNAEVAVDSTPAWIAAAMAGIAAISAIVCVVVLTRKLAG